MAVATDAVSVGRSGRKVVAQVDLVHPIRTLVRGDAAIQVGVPFDALGELLAGTVFEDRGQGVHIRAPEEARPG